MPNKLATFSEFVAHRSESEAVAEARNTPKNINDALPVMLTFRRMEIRQWSDGSVVGLYREQRTGMEIVLS
jgi:hypothetical protein